METEAQRKAKLQKTKEKFEQLGLNKAGRTIGIGVRGVAKGLPSIPDFFSSIINLAGSAVGANPNIPLISDEIGSEFDRATAGAFQPKTLGEKAIGTGLEFASGGVAFNPAAKAIGGKIGSALTTKGAQELAAATGAGAGLELGREYMPDSIAGQLGTSLLGGMAGAKGARIAANPVQELGRYIPKNMASNLFSINPEKIKAFQAAGIDPTLSNVSDSKIVGMTENLAGNIPFVSSPIENAILNTQQKISEYGTGISREKAGTIAQESLKGWRNKAFNIIDKLQENVSRHVEPYTPVKLNNTLDVISNKPSVYTDVAKNIIETSPSGKKFAQIETALEQVKNAAEQNLKQFYGGEKNALGNPEFIKQFGRIADSVESLKNGDVLPYSDTVIIRKSIDNTLDGKFGNVELGKDQTNILKQLRTGLQKDISNTLEQISPQAAKDNARFNKFYTQFAKKNDEAVAPLLENKTVTETFRDIINNTTVDADKAKTVFSTLKPEQKQTFTKAIVTELGSNPQNEFNSSTLATKFKKLDKGAQDIALSGFTPKEKEKFRATIDVIDAIKDTVKTGNPSRTAYTSALLALGGSFGAAPISTSAILALGRLGSGTLLANPKFINWVSKASNLKTPAQFEKHLKGLEILAKNSPELSSDIIQYTNTLNELQNDEELRNDTLQWDQEEFERLNAKYGNDSNVVPDQAEPQLGEATEGMQVNASELPSNPRKLTNEPEQDVEWDQEEWERLNAKYGNKESTTKVDDALIDKIAQVESGGNPNAKAKTSTASGVLQFTDNTWREGVKKYGNELGITMRDKANPKAQKAIAAKMLEENAQDLQTFLNRDPTESEIYLTHFLGLEGAKKLLRSPPSELAAKMFPAAAKANKSIFFKNGKALTNRQLIAMLEDKITKA